MSIIACIADSSTILLTGSQCFMFKHLICNTHSLVEKGNMAAQWYHKAMTQRSPVSIGRRRWGERLDLKWRPKRNKMKSKSPRTVMLNVMCGG